MSCYKPYPDCLCHCLQTFAYGHMSSQYVRSNQWSHFIVLPSYFQKMLFLKGEKDRSGEGGGVPSIDLYITQRPTHWQPLLLVGVYPGYRSKEITWGNYSVSLSLLGVLFVLKPKNDKPTDLPLVIGSSSQILALGSLRWLDATYFYLGEGEQCCKCLKCLK